MVEPGGEAVDWILGYDPPADSFLALLRKSLTGEETFKTLSDKYARNPKDIGIVFKLAKKYNDRFIEDKTVEKYKEVLALDPEGKSGYYTLPGSGKQVRYVEYAEYALAELSMFMPGSGKPSAEPFKAFVKKHPEGPLTKRAWSMMANYYDQAPKEEAGLFFEDYTSKYPHDPAAWHAWLSRIVKDKDNLDKGIEIAARIRDLSEEDPLPQYSRTIAELYIAKGDKAGAQGAYGKTYIENQASSLAYSLIGYANFWFQQAENKESALEMAELAFKIYPENWYMRQQAALANVRMEKFDRAIELYGPVFLGENKDNPMGLRQYARFWANQGQGRNLDSALAAVQRLRELAPEAVWTWDAAATVYLKRKQYDDAVMAAQKAADLADADNKEYLTKKLDQLKATIEKEKAAEKK